MDRGAEQTGNPRHDHSPTNDLESAILRNVDLGAYTVFVRNPAEGAGVGLVEVYDMGSAQDPNKRAAYRL